MVARGVYAARSWLPWLIAIGKVLAIAPGVIITCHLVSKPILELRVPDWIRVRGHAAGLSESERRPRVGLHLLLLFLEELEHHVLHETLKVKVPSPLPLSPHLFVQRLPAQLVLVKRSFTESDLGGGMGVVTNGARV